jgi:hypothetical protein
LKSQRQPADLSPLSLHSWDRDAILTGRLVAQSGDHGSFGLDSFRSCDGAATNRRGVISDGTGEPAGEVGVPP